MIYAYRTETGLRKSNQDFFYTPAAGAKPYVIVADGMGGHRAGNIASLLAIESICEYIDKNDDSLRKQQMLQHAISYANHKIFDIASHDDDCMGMGTTVVMAYVDSKKFSYAHVGDSRLYHYDGSQLKQMTRDHSFVEELVSSGAITRAQAVHHPQRNILTRAVGTSQYIKADAATGSWKRGDILMLCSDGLHGSVSRDEAMRILGGGYDLLEACDLMTELALRNGSRDNITVVLVKNEGGENA
ncbi:MAG: Stp1/IreP family PP2C-type Ser/Thr phosphatase [Christensenellaceae bacterium]|nr:Stp1/IreP family PP2C-type Ser/Thr phosphatase [Christensenellaceae bacterium]